MSFNPNHFSPSSTSSSSPSPNVNTYNEQMMPLQYTQTVTYYPIQYQQESEYNEKRSAHNALERQRREGLNNKFQELAHVLPALRQVRRPSKSMIVAKSLEFVSSAGERETTYQHQIQALRKENEQLMRQAQLSKKIKKKKLVTAEEDEPQVEAKKRFRESSEEEVEEDEDEEDEDEYEEETITVHMNKKRKQTTQQLASTVRKKPSSSIIISTRKPASSSSSSSSSSTEKTTTNKLPVTISPSKSQPLVPKKTTIKDIKISPSASLPIIKISKPVTRSAPPLNGQSTSKMSPPPPSPPQLTQPIVVRTQQVNHPLAMDQNELDLLQSYINSISSSQDNDILDSFIQNDQFFPWH